MQRIADGGGANAMDGRGELTLGPPAKPLGPFAATPKPGHADGGATSKDDGTPMHLEGFGFGLGFGLADPNLPYPLTRHTHAPRTLTLTLTLTLALTLTRHTHASRGAAGGG